MNHLALELGNKKRAGNTSLARWHRLFYVLVALAVLTVSLSLYLSNQFMRIYVDSLAVNQAWVERLHECAYLGQLAGNVNAPGNDVFQTHQVEKESNRMEAALLLFNQRLQAFQKELQNHVEETQAVPLVKRLQGVGNLMQEMATEGQRLFAYLKNQQPTEAGECMAAMDRSFAKANGELEDLRKQIAAIQNQHFERQTDAAISLQRFEYGMAALIVVMTGGTLIYGHKVRRQVETATQEKERYLEALRESESQLARQKAAQVRRQLLKKVMSAQEDERRRIARDLHDVIGQSLTSVLIGLRTVAQADTLEAARQRMEELRDIAVATIEEVGRLARGLRPSVLDDMGLKAALERYAADFSHANGIEVLILAPSDPPDRFPEEVETALYRIAQEGLTNISRHAAATQARIILERGPGQVQMTVADDGRGFDPMAADASGRLGLQGIRERAALLNGSVEIESFPGKGTKLTVRIPLEENNHGEDSRSGGG